MLITVISGGTGSARFIRGLAGVLSQEQLTVIVNVGDNIRLLGLNICPDIDTILYMFAGLLDRKRGWGIGHDTFRLQKMLQSYGWEAWFKLGDLDMAMHLYRTHLMQQKLSLTKATQQFSRALGVKARILPATDKWVETMIHTPHGVMHFQEFWVKRRGRDRVLKVTFKGASCAQPAPGVTEAILEAEGIIITPANPVTSIKPTLSIPGVETALKKASAQVLAISPILGTRPFSGPTGKLLKAMGLPVSPYSVAKLYNRFLDVFLIHNRDIACKAEIEQLGIRCVPTDIRMGSPSAERRLAAIVLRNLGLDTSLSSI